jgi:hypothetical protein
MTRSDLRTIVLGTVLTTTCTAAPLIALRVYLWHRAGIAVSW